MTENFCMPVHLLVETKALRCFINTCMVGISEYLMPMADLTRYRLVASERPANLPLVRSEPIWREIAEEKNPGNIKFSHRVIDLIQHDDHVLVIVQPPDGPQVTYRAQYVVAAEGGKGIVAPKIGAVLEGPTDIADVVSVHFEADLSQYWDERTLMLNSSTPKARQSLAAVRLSAWAPPLDATLKTGRSTLASGLMTLRDSRRLRSIC